MAQQTSINTYQFGTTVRFVVNFYDFDGNPIDPDIINIIIYDQKYNQIFSQVVDSNTKTGVGSYFYDYITAPKEQKMYYEWNGTINGKPSLKRGTIMTKFM